MQQEELFGFDIFAFLVSMSGNNVGSSNMRFTGNYPNCVYLFCSSLFKIFFLTLFVGVETSV